MVPIVIIAVGLIVGFTVSALVAWKVWGAKHGETLEARRSIRRRADL
jgi:hypothetical protein